MSCNTICPRCGRTPIPGCGGRGYFLIDETTVRPCRNLYIKQLTQHLGTEISISNHVTKSPLYEMGEQPGDPPKVDRTEENLVLRVESWYSLLPHLKWTLGCKGLDFRFKILTDLEVVTVKVGATSKDSQGKTRAESDEVFNHIGDLIEDYDLLILKVGQMGYKNRAAAGALYELLLIRESQRRPVWVVIDGEKPWDTMNPDTQSYGYSYSSEVQSYLNRWFDYITMPPADPGERLVASSENFIVEDEPTPEPKTRAVTKTTKPLPAIPELNLDNLDNVLPGENNSKKTKWGRR